MNEKDHIRVPRWFIKRRPGLRSFPAGRRIAGPAALWRRALRLCSVESYLFPLAAMLLLGLGGLPSAAWAAGKSPHLPMYRIPLRVHIESSGRAAGDFLPVFREINAIWSQAGICFEIEAVYHDQTVADGLDMWFAPDIGGYNGYFDGEHIQMSDHPVLAPAPHPARHPAARTAAHELGHALGLGHRQGSADNLMRSQTKGWQLSEEEIRVARDNAEFLAVTGSASPCAKPHLDKEAP